MVKDLKRIEIEQLPFRVQYLKHKYYARISLSKNPKNSNFDDMLLNQTIYFQMEITHSLFT